MIDMDLSLLAGRFFLFGFEGVDINSLLENQLKKDKISGVILFKRNIESIESVKKLNEKIKKTVNHPMFIGVDQEGGRVARLDEPFYKTPSMREIAKTKTPQEAEEIAFILGIELKKLGFNLNFAPVLDIDSNPKNPVIGDRSFGDNVEIVSQYGVSFIKGFKRAKVASCGKHFPGHGDTHIDSHLDLPFAEDSLESLRNRELIPFKKGIEAGVDSIMSAHILFSHIAQNPATLSPLFLTNILRSELGFNGVLFSDDMNMNAMKDKYSIQEMVYNGIEAGVDIFVVSHNIDDLQQAMLEYTKQLFSSKEISPDRVLKSLSRVDKLLIDINY